jgi:hypothetical protein
MELYKDCARGRTARQCHQGLQEVCGESALPYRTVAWWVEILQAVDRYIRTINTTGAAKGILQLPHRWQRVVHNAGDYNERE